jgi:hypothetical protein
MLGEPVVVIGLFERDTEIVDVQLLVCLAVLNDWPEARNTDDFRPGR